MSSDHPYLSLRIPPNAPFELKPSPGKGWGAFATREIKKGDLILSEKPICAAPTRNGKLRLQELQKAIDSITDANLVQLSLLRNRTGEPFISPQEAFAENNFTPRLINNSTSELYILQSRFNHSCEPNSLIYHLEASVISRYACKRIAPGEEITFCYSVTLGSLTKAERHSVLRFICKCPRCVLAPPLQELSDVRRRLFRGLRYLSLGKDIDLPMETNGRPLITNLALKRAAENLELPISEEFFYSALSAVVAEQERILNVDVEESIEHDMSRCLYAFATPSNIKVARLAMMKTTWIAKLELAVSIRGQRDEFDAMYTMFRKRLA